MKIFNSPKFYTWICKIEFLLKLFWFDLKYNKQHYEHDCHLILTRTMWKIDRSRNDFGIIPTEIADILEASSEHLYRIYLSIMANTLALKKTKNITDCLIYRDQYASNMAQAVLSELTTILNSMEIALHTRLKVSIK